MSGERALEGKVAWVVGASGGIGAAILSAMLEAGATAVGTSSSGKGGLHACDITDPAAIDRFAEELWVQHGSIDILVNSAGVLVRKETLDITVEEWDRIFDVNVRGPFLCSKAVARRLVAAGRPGSIVNVGSINAWVANANSSPYAASKGALQSLTYALAVAWGKYGIRVNAVAPGTIPTGINEERWKAPGNYEKAVANIPLGRLGRPEEVAPAVVFLASDASCYTTGAVLSVHGGKTLVA